MNSHPKRVPIHKDQLKGQVFGGECNADFCRNTGAMWWNLKTFALFCAECADRINHPKNIPLLCIKVKEKPLVEDMEKLRQDNHY